MGNDTGMLHRDDVARLEALGMRLRQQAADLAAAEYRWLVALEEFDRDGGWALEGAKSCAAWLGWACGLSPEAARERVRVARALPDLPLASARFAAGELSYSQVRAISRVATPDSEELLVTYATHATAAQLEAVVRGYRGVRRSEEADEGPEGALAHRERRRLDWRTDAEGYVRLSARLPAEEGMVVIKAIEAVADDLGERLVAPREGQPEDPALGSGGRPVALKRWQTPEPTAVRAADALVVLAETTLAHGPAARTGDERYQVVVVVVRGDSQAETGGATDACTGTSVGWLPPHLAHLAGELSVPLPGEPPLPPDPPAYLAGDPGIDETTVQRLSCDASLVTLVEDALGRPLGVGRKSRTVPRWLRRALTRRDRGCRFPGCTTTRFLDAQHVWHWSLGGPTELDNLVLLCRFHHTLVHEGGFAIALSAPGRFTFHRPDGSLIRPAAPMLAGDPVRPGAGNAADGAAPTADSLIPDWDGTPQNIDAAIEALCAITQPVSAEPPDASHAPRVSAETRSTPLVPYNRVEPQHA